MKRWLTILMLALTLGTGLLTGCGAEGDDDDGDLNNPGLVQPGEDGEGDGDD
ncbi:MAG TPA: hypothetical protein VGD58_10430 [Herpetosiphonaceae bacterium]